MARRKTTGADAGADAIDQPIVGYRRDDEGHWVAELACGHAQHVRHAPPWTSRPWVTTPAGRDAHLGTMLACRKCAVGVPPDRGR